MKIESAVVIRDTGNSLPMALVWPRSNVAQSSNGNLYSWTQGPKSVFNVKLIKSSVASGRDRRISRNDVHPANIFVCSSTISSNVNDQRSTTTSKTLLTSAGFIINFSMS